MFRYGRSEVNRTPITRLSDAFPTVERHYDVGAARGYRTHSNLLSSGFTVRAASLTVYDSILELRKGIEPSLSAWKAGVLPLHQRSILGGSKRFELFQAEPQTAVLPLH